MKSFQVIFMKLLNFGVDPTQNGQMAAILDLCYDILHMDQLHAGAAWRMLIRINGNKSWIIVGLGVHVWSTEGSVVKLLDTMYTLYISGSRSGENREVGLGTLLKTRAKMNSE